MVVGIPGIMFFSSTFWEKNFSFRPPKFSSKFSTLKKNNPKNTHPRHGRFRPPPVAPSSFAVFFQDVERFHPINSTTKKKKLPGKPRKVPFFLRQLWMVLGVSSWWKLTATGGPGIFYWWNLPENPSYHRIHGHGIFTYMNGEKWPHEQGEMGW